MGSVSDLIKDVKLPKMIKVRQKFDKNFISDIPKEMRNQFDRPEIKALVKPGMTIAIAVGSRGITNIALIIKETVAFIKSLGARPFIVPAMGSHGGATAEGQRNVLADYGITEEYICAPVKSSMEVVELHTFEDGMKVYCDKFASEADAIVVVNRIKPHTCFRGVYESGLMKIMAIGLGKQIGAYSYHEKGFGMFAGNVERVGKIFLEKTNTIFGVGIVENAFDDTYRISILTNKEIPLLEPALLEESRRLMPRIYFDNLDALVVDWIGKNFSGDGMDPNITGAFVTPYASGGIKTRRIAVLDLSEESYGNACGAGVADTSTRRLFNKFDFDKTYPNSLTSTVSLVSKVPIILKNQKEAIQAAVMMSFGADKNNLRLVRIANTLHLEYVYISEALKNEAENNENVEIISEPAEFDFNENGDLF